jgi:hypothetical protein
MHAGTDRPRADGDHRGFFRRDGRRDRRLVYRLCRTPASREGLLRSEGADEEGPATSHSAARGRSRNSLVGSWTIGTRPHSTTKAAFRMTHPRPRGKDRRDDDDGRDPKATDQGPGPSAMVRPRTAAAVRPVLGVLVRWHGGASGRPRDEAMNARPAARWPRTPTDQKIGS